METVVEMEETKVVVDREVKMVEVVKEAVQVVDWVVEETVAKKEVRMERVVVVVVVVTMVVVRVEDV